VIQKYLLKHSGRTTRSAPWDTALLIMVLAFAKLIILFYSSYPFRDLTEETIIWHKPIRNFIDLMAADADMEVC